VYRTFISSAVVAASLASAAAQGSVAQFRRYDAVPAVYGSDLGRFRDLLISAGTGTVRLGVIGDSQETSPDGGGNLCATPPTSVRAALWR